jgi:hypothetical protein
VLALLGSLTAAGCSNSEAAPPAPPDPGSERDASFPGSPPALDEPTAPCGGDPTGTWRFVDVFQRVDTQQFDDACNGVGPQGVLHGYVYERWATSGVVGFESDGTYREAVAWSGSHEVYVGGDCFAGLGIAGCDEAGERINGDPDSCLPVDDYCYCVGGQETEATTGGALINAGRSVRAGQWTVEGTEAVFAFDDGGERRTGLCVETDRLSLVIHDDTWVPTWLFDRVE